MAGELTQKKIENLGEVTEPVDADVFLHGSGGGNVIKKISWGNLVKKLRSILFVNNTTTTEEGYGADARVAAKLQEEVNELNTKIKDYVKVVTQIGPSTFAIKAGQAMEASNYMTLPSLSGYTRAFYIAKPNGNPAVLSAGPNSGWIVNTGNTDAGSIRIDVISVFIKNV